MTDTSRASTSTPPLRPSSVILFWLPLAATWLMMGLELPYIAAIVARMPAAESNLAAFGVATSLAWLVESPIMMLLSAATALVRDRGSYLALRRFAFLLNGAVTGGMVLLALPAVFHIVGEQLIGLPRDISRLAHASSAILILWPGAIGYRRFYQGILLRHHLPRRVAYGTVIRLGSMSGTAALLALTVRMPGAMLGAIALVTGVVCEAVASRLMARHIVKRLMQATEPSAAPLDLPAITRFYYPLALTSVLSMALGPLVTFGLGRGRAPIESLAVWPVVNSAIFLFRSGGVAFQEVGIALAGAHPANEHQVRRTALWLGSLVSLALAIGTFTPLQAIWFQGVSGLEPSLAAYAVWPVRILVALPALEYVLSVQRVRWILTRRTGVVTVATAVETAGLAATLVVAIGPLNMVGVIGGALGLLLGRVAANAFLYVQEQRATA